MATNVPNLIADWRARAKMYQERFYQSTQRREYIIAAQQQGLATAFTICANELEANLTYEGHYELRNRAGAA